MAAPPLRKNDLHRKSHQQTSCRSRRTHNVHDFHESVKNRGNGRQIEVHTPVITPIKTLGTRGSLAKDPLHSLRTATADLIAD
ncbi:Hypothetical protein NTJ_08796 [Nesidiocoris tenuis]|uniref:Uncharacterized protein n=1 Tax=Nesidiocoris tenuis TaxID=355587 RepID=A0ABN7AX97_9HEMI|nr:Hypothetical protein NTJ_08796 [Nesidiocoris tenuis]